MGDDSLATILMIDDSKQQRAQFRAALDAAGCFDRILEAEDGLSGLRLLLTHPVDIVLCDLEMPGLDGEKLLHASASREEGRNVPFLFITGSENVDRRVRLMERGAHDVIRKPFHPGDLIARLRLHLRIRKLEDDLSARNAELERLSTTDELTRVRNRRFADEVLDREVHRARRHGSPLSVLMIDLDHFKSINDGFGHAAGDAVLRETGRRIRNLLRRSDVAARYGGEEFLIVLAPSNANGAQIAAERWRSSISDEPFTLPHDVHVSVTASIGVATFRPEFSSPRDLVAAADEALYWAKRDGRNCVRSAPTSV
jgi:diguanylate cyclase (GGDEF)-like protein